MSEFEIHVAFWGLYAFVWVALFLVVRVLSQIRDAIKEKPQTSLSVGKGCTVTVFDKEKLAEDILRSQREQ